MGVPSNRHPVTTTVAVTPRLRKWLRLRTGVWNLTAHTMAMLMTVLIEMASQSWRTDAISRSIAKICRMKIVQLKEEMRYYSRTRRQIVAYSVRAAARLCLEQVLLISIRVNPRIWSISLLKKQNQTCQLMLEKSFKAILLPFLAPTLSQKWIDQIKSEIEVHRYSFLYLLHASALLCCIQNKEWYDP